MKRLLGLAVLALALLAAPVWADGFGPGYFNLGANVNSAWGPGYPPGGGKPTVKPGVYGPWYNYWPLEAHFQVPAHPQYPYWPSPQTLPNGAPVAAPATINYPPVAAPPAAPAPQRRPAITHQRPAMVQDRPPMPRREAATITHNPAMLRKRLGTTRPTGTIRGQRVMLLRPPPALPGVDRRDGNTGTCGQPGWLAPAPAFRFLCSSPRKRESISAIAFLDVASPYRTSLHPRTHQEPAFNGLSNKAAG